MMEQPKNEACKGEFGATTLPRSCDANDMTCDITMYADSENKVYTVDYTFHSDLAQYHSETTIIFHSEHKACVYLAALRKKCIVNHIPYDEMIEVI